MTDATAGFSTRLNPWSISLKGVRGGLMLLARHITLTASYAYKAGERGLQLVDEDGEYWRVMNFSGHRWTGSHPEHGERDFTASRIDGFQTVADAG